MKEQSLRLKSFTDLHDFDWLTCHSCRRLVWWDSKSDQPMPTTCNNCGQILLPTT